MPNKTIYVRNESLWDDAKKLAADLDVSLSTLVERAMIDYVYVEVDADVKQVERLADEIQKSKPQYTRERCLHTARRVLRGI